eukprot:374273-Alexandrium_andersonii.AAC.1
MGCGARAGALKHRHVFGRRLRPAYVLSDQKPRKRSKPETATRDHRLRSAGGPTNMLHNARQCRHRPQCGIFASQ